MRALLRLGVLLSTVWAAGCWQKPGAKESNAVWEFNGKITEIGPEGLTIEVEEKDNPHVEATYVKLDVKEPKTLGNLHVGDDVQAKLTESGKWIISK